LGALTIALHDRDKSMTACIHSLNGVTTGTGNGGNF